MPIDGGGGAGYAAPAPPVSCDFGPFGEQTQVNLETLGTQKLCKIHFCAFPTHGCCIRYPFFIPSLIDTAIVALLTAQFLPESRAHVFNTGASVWGLDWCPIHPDDRPRKYISVYSGTPLTSRAEPDCSYKYYLAVAPLPSSAHSPEIGIKVPRPSRSCIQLWSLGRSAGVEECGDDNGEMHCEMVLCIDSGTAMELKWCPLPSHDPVCTEILPLVASARVYEATKSCRDHLQPLRES